MVAKIILITAGILAVFGIISTQEFVDMGGWVRPVLCIRTAFSPNV